MRIDDLTRMGATIGHVAPVTHGPDVLNHNGPIVFTFEGPKANMPFDLPPRLHADNFTAVLGERAAPKPGRVVRGVRAMFRAAHTILDAIEDAIELAIASQTPSDPGSPTQ